MASKVVRGASKVAVEARCVALREAGKGGQECSCWLVILGD